MTIFNIIGSIIIIFFLDFLLCNWLETITYNNEIKTKERINNNKTENRVKEIEKIKSTNGLFFISIDNIKLEETSEESYKNKFLDKKPHNLLYDFILAIDNINKRIDNNISYIYTNNNLFSKYFKLYLNSFSCENWEADIFSMLYLSVKMIKNDNISNNMYILSEFEKSNDEIDDMLLLIDRDNKLNKLQKIIKEK